jgi:hypothetical protein
MRSVWSTARFWAGCTHLPFSSVPSVFWSASPRAAFSNSERSNRAINSGGLRADLAVGLAFLLVVHQGARHHHHADLGVAVERHEAAGPKTFSFGPMPRCDLERVVGAFAASGSPRFLPGLLGPGLGGCQGFGCGLCASFACASWCPFLTRAAPGPKRRRSAAGQ